MFFNVSCSLPYTAKTMKLLSRLLLFAVALICALSAEARVVRVEVLSRTQISSNSPGVPAYEKIVARVHFAVSPENTHNRRIVDLDKADTASRNSQGEVE